MDRKEIEPGIYLTVVSEYKFKMSCISLNVIAPLKRETAAMGAVLPYVLRRGTASRPDMRTIEAYLDDLYGARLEAFVRKRGEMQITGFYADFADEAFVGRESRILEKITELMGEMLLSPATQGGRLKKKYVDTERENLLADIRASLNDKRGYANLKLMENMFRGENYGVPKLGREREAEKISVATLTKYYKDLISSAPIEVIYVGPCDPMRVERAVRGALGARLYKGGAEIPATVVISEPKGKVKVIREEMPLRQAKLALGYRIGNPDSLMHPAVTVMNAVFGGCVTSKLFREVRERLGLCYYASSAADRMKGVMFVSCGIDTEKYDEAMAAIEGELTKLQTGDISDEELTGAKKSVVNALLSAEDSLPAMEAMTLNFIVFGVSMMPAELAALCDLVTKDEIIKAAEKIKLDTVFFLAGKGESDV